MVAHLELDELGVEMLLAGERPMALASQEACATKRQVAIQAAEEDATSSEAKALALTAEIESLAESPERTNKEHARSVAQINATAQRKHAAAIRAEQEAEPARLSSQKAQQILAASQALVAQFNATAMDAVVQRQRVAEAEAEAVSRLAAAARSRLQEDAAGLELMLADDEKTAAKAAMGHQKVALAAIEQLVQRRQSVARAAMDLTARMQHQADLATREDGPEKTHAWATAQLKAAQMNVALQEAQVAASEAEDAWRRTDAAVPGWQGTTIPAPKLQAVREEQGAVLVAHGALLHARRDLLETARARCDVATEQVTVASMPPGEAHTAARKSLQIQVGQVLSRLAFEEAEVADAQAALAALEEEACKASLEAAKRQLAGVFDEHEKRQGAAELELQVAEYDAKYHLAFSRGKLAQIMFEKAAVTAAKGASVEAVVLGPSLFDRRPERAVVERIVYDLGPRGENVAAEIHDVQVLFRHILGLPDSAFLVEHRDVLEYVGLKPKAIVEKLCLSLPKIRLDRYYRARYQEDAVREEVKRRWDKALRAAEAAATAAGVKLNESVGSLFDQRPDKHQVRRIVEALDTSDDGILSASEVKVLFSKILNMPLEEIRDDHPEARRIPQPCAR